MRRRPPFGLLAFCLLAADLGCATGEVLGGAGDAGAGLSADGAPGSGDSGRAGGAGGAASGGASSGGNASGGKASGGNSSGGASSSGGSSGGASSGGGSSGGASSGGAGGGAPCGTGLKRCGTQCVAPSPANGCDGACVACAAPPLNGISACAAGQCDFTCATAYTKNGSACQAAPACTDSKLNGTESDVDCGGTLCPKCAPGRKCSTNADCGRGPCESGVCGCTADTCATAATCAASVDDGCGKKLDCTTSCATPAICYQTKCCTPIKACPAKACAASVPDGCGGSLDCTRNCTTPDVCFSSQCCTPQACGTQCGKVTDGCGTALDCGVCADGKACKTNADCANGACEAGTCVSCMDLKKNHGESAVDCGGTSCPKCGNGSTCTTATDCVSNHCCGLLEFGSCTLKAGTCQ